ncbi:hypothetical protein CMEL01_05567 [Colletotrichum melonis]|uniref:Secreted protein n=1 Tax=Colletotrichum melonis TaxID=1209925 RepID=A0AAI9UAX8_9PEZI|nr:hypothetical protein CMEL01_05567 [Colletotrichum melonis]
MSPRVDMGCWGRLLLLIFGVWSVICKNCGSQARSRTFWLFPYYYTPGYGPISPRNTLRLLSSEKAYTTKSQLEEGQVSSESRSSWVRRVRLSKVTVTASKQT